MEVTCESELIEVDGRRLVFSLRAYDAQGIVGEGTHERFIIQNEKFQQKANAKREK
jgi:predicted thioesterase